MRMSVARSPEHVPLSAILLIVGAVGCFSVLDSIVKYLAPLYPVPLLVWARYAVQAVAIVLWLGPTMRWELLRTRQPAMQVARGAIVLLSSLCFFNALKYLPLAEATAINYTTPTLVILLSVVVLRERMTLPRWAFVAAGALGTIFVVRPGANQWPDDELSNDFASNPLDAWKGRIEVRTSSPPVRWARFSSSGPARRSCTAPRCSLWSVRVFTRPSRS